MGGTENWLWWGPEAKAEFMKEGNEEKGKIGVEVGGIG